MGNAQTYSSIRTQSVIDSAAVYHFCTRASRQPGHGPSGQLSYIATHKYGICIHSVIDTTSAQQCIVCTRASGPVGAEILPVQPQEVHYRAALESAGVRQGSLYILLLLLLHCIIIISFLGACHATASAASTPCPLESVSSFPRVVQFWAPNDPCRLDDCSNASCQLIHTPSAHCMPPLYECPLILAVAASADVQDGITLVHAHRL
jgi:hypothetical protein